MGEFVKPKLTTLILTVSLTLGGCASNSSGEVARHFRGKATVAGSNLIAMNGRTMRLYGFLPHDRTEAQEYAIQVLGQLLKDAEVGCTERWENPRYIVVSCAVLRDIPHKGFEKGFAGGTGLVGLMLRAGAGFI